MLGVLCRSFANASLYITLKSKGKRGVFMSLRWTFLWNDLDQANAITTFDTIDLHTFNPLLLQACTAYFLQDIWSGTVIRNAAPVTNSFFRFQSCRAQAQLFYVGGASCEIAQLRIPAPIFAEPPADPGVFCTDAFSVDPGLVADITTATIARLVDAGAGVCDAFAGGMLQYDLSNQSRLIAGDGMGSIITVKWIDPYGQVVETNWYQAAPDTVIRDRIKHHSNADWLEWWYGVPFEPPFQAPTIGSFDIYDQARLKFRSSSGATVTVAIPAPKDVLFKSDKRTVDPANALVHSLVVNIIANAQCRDGTTVTEFIGGRRVRMGGQNRRSIDRVGGA